MKESMKVMLFAACVFVIFHLDAQEMKKADKIIIANSTFFYEIPSEIKNSLISKDMKMFTLSTPDGTKAIGIYAPSITLSEKAMKFAIPPEEVPEGAELLRRYNEAVKNSKGLSFTISKSEPLVKAGDRFPEFSATDINGKTWTNADVEGKVMVLNLWFTGCGPCRAEMPELSEWKNEMPEVMFFSSTYESPEIARQVLDKGTFNWIALVNDTQFKKFIGSNGYPLTIVVDKNGTIAKVEYGTSPEQREELKKTILSLR